MKKNHQDTNSCVVSNVAYLPKVYIPHYYHNVIIILKKLKDQSQNSQNRRSGDKTNHIYDTYKIQSCHIDVIFTPEHLVW